MYEFDERPYATKRSTVSLNNHHRSFVSNNISIRRDIRDKERAFTACKYFQIKFSNYI
jgi:hypothetical protein